MKDLVSCPSPESSNTHPGVIKPQIIPSEPSVTVKACNHTGHTLWATYLVHEEEEMKA